MVIWREGGLSTLCHSRSVACQHRVLNKRFLALAASAPKMGLSEYSMAFLGKDAYIWLTILSSNGSVPLPYVKVSALESKIDILEAESKLLKENCLKKQKLLEVAIEHNYLLFSYYRGRLNDEACKRP